MSFILANPKGDNIIDSKKLCSNNKRCANKAKQTLPKN